MKFQADGFPNEREIITLMCSWPMKKAAAHLIQFKKVLHSAVNDGMKTFWFDIPQFANTDWAPVCQYFLKRNFEIMKKKEQNLQTQQLENFIPQNLVKKAGIEYVQELMNLLSFEDSPLYFDNGPDAFLVLFKEIMARLAIDQRKSNDKNERWSLV